MPGPRQVSRNTTRTQLYAGYSVCSSFPAPTRSLLHMWETDPSCSHLPGPPLGAFQLSSANGGVMVGIEKSEDVGSPFKFPVPTGQLLHATSFLMASGYSRGWELLPMLAGLWVLYHPMFDLIVLPRPLKIVLSLKFLPLNHLTVTSVPCLDSERHFT